MIDIIINKDFSDLPELLAGKDVYIVNDSAVEGLTDEISGLVEAKGRLSIDISPEVKTIDTVCDICRFLLALKADRNAFLLAVGGGTLTDIAAFAASVYKRGIAFGLVPTTLLAQVDASIGGKTGVNLDGYKNVVGTFSWPEFTYICPRSMEGLPRREWLSGCAEMLKAFIIADKRFYEKAVKELPAMAPEDASDLIERAIDIKAEIVENDPYEEGPRRALNLGHTFAHAIEWREASLPEEEKHTHGEAVAIGIIMAAELSEQRGIAPEGLADALRQDFLACSLPVSCDYSTDELQEAIVNDKKNAGGEIRYVLIENIGRVKI